MRIALVGQPNCGKSTLFNQWVGAKAHTSNLPGTTVEFLESDALIDGRRVTIVDLPGTYSLTSLDEAEVETRNVLLGPSIDAIVNVLDASLLSRSLELTLELLELGRPLVVCLNMADEAKRKGVQIDADTLSDALGVRVLVTTARRGLGVKALATAAVAVAEIGQPACPVVFSADVERVLRAVETAAASAERPPGASPRLAAVKLLERDPFFEAWAAERAAAALDAVAGAAPPLEEARGADRAAIVAAERHARAMEIAEKAATVGHPTLTWSDRIDAAIMHPILGLPLLGLVLYGLFLAVFSGGALLEAPLFGLFETWTARIAELLGAESFLFAIVRGLVLGLGGALGLVLPYLVPFLVGMTILEDVGYLPRVGYLIDGLMHRIGLHGKSAIPLILGYGCSVPAVMATRMLDSRRDRVVTATLAVLTPCVARATVIFGLVGAFVGAHWAFALFVVNLVVIAAVGRLLTVILPTPTPGLILEIPTYRAPSLRTVAGTVWFRVRDFLKTATPLLVLGSAAMSLLDFVGADTVLNWIARPFTWAIGIPFVLGIPLVFGVFRKELALVMVVQAVGTAELASALTRGEMVTFTLFVLFYIPCVATIAVLRRELGWRATLAISGGTVLIATLVGVLSRGFFAFVG